MTNQSGPVFADVEDTRVIPTGSFLRRSHLDELPQLWNVLRGDMLLVGPRPEQPGPYALLSKLLVGYDSRVLMKPGMVALSNLRDGYARSIPEHRRRRVVWDRWYIRNRSISTDLILLDRPPSVPLEVMHSGGMIGIDGYNLGLPQGTGIKTYGINLIKSIGSAGFQPEILHEARLRGRTRAACCGGLFDALKVPGVCWIGAHGPGLIRTAWDASQIGSN